MELNKMENVYTCFAESHMDPVKRHCTHKFFGPVDALDVLSILSVIDQFELLMQRRYGGMPAILGVFEDQASFGKNKDVSVLTGQISLLSVYDPLRAYFDLIVEDEFSPFIPHVTTDLNPSQQFNFDRYILMQGKTVLKIWRLS